MRTNKKRTWAVTVALATVLGVSCGILLYSTGGQDAVAFTGEIPEESTPFVGEGDVTAMPARRFAFAGSQESENLTGPSSHDTSDATEVAPPDANEMKEAYGASSNPEDASSQAMPAPAIAGAGAPRSSYAGSVGSGGRLAYASFGGVGGGGGSADGGSGGTGSGSATGPNPAPVTDATPPKGNDTPPSGDPTPETGPVKNDPPGQDPGPGTNLPEPSDDPSEPQGDPPVEEEDDELPYIPPQPEDPSKPQVTVPEPGSLALLALGVSALALRRRRRVQD